MNKEFISFAKKFYKNIEHPLAVSDKFETLSDEWVVALFHDILEDTNIDRNLLLDFLCSYGKENVYIEIEKITRNENEKYFDYIKKLNGIAKTVKIEDLKHNLSRVETITDSLKKRYEKALKILD